VLSDQAPVKAIGARFRAPTHTSQKVEEDC
jgi:hypothetical protein